MDSPVAPSAARRCRVRPELLAPAGDWESVRAAVENGADAVYFGLDRFNARMRAKNFTLPDLPALVEFLHLRGVRGYVTFNTLVFADEMAEAEVYLRRLIASGIDAVIVQDVGICRLIRRLSPDFPIHASTQMSVTSAAGVAFARELGCSLVVLARENSLHEIERIRAQLGSGALPLEVFVHGALCVAYSGQCLTSEALGGRSANRGECAQACRLPYDLVSDGREVDLGGRRYLLSPQDLAGIEVLPQLVRAGVASLKIEGRLKSPEYVAAVTRAYRAALDRVISEDLASDPARAAAASAIAAEHRYSLEMAFSRGLYTGWFEGIDNRRLVHARFGTKRGVFLGTVEGVHPASCEVTVHLEGPVEPGDGVVFDAGRPEEGETGGRVRGLHRPGSGVARLAFGRGTVDFRRVAAGHLVWKTSDPAHQRAVRLTFEGEAPRFRRPVDIAAHGAAGLPLTAELSDDEGNLVRAESAVPLETAHHQPLTTELLERQLGRLGGTPFHLRTLLNELQGEVLLPLSELNRVRRELVARLAAARARPKRWQLETSEECYRLTSEERAVERPQEDRPRLIAVVRSTAQLEAVWGAGARTVYCEFEDPRRYREAVALFRTLAADVRPDPEDPALGAPAEVWVAPPRICKPGEEGILRAVRASEADGFLVRNYDHAAAFADCRLRGDFSLNVANALAAAYWVVHYGLERVTASYDLNTAQLAALLASAPPSWFEITLHQHMPLFHMEHCVFCAFLSNGKDFRDCGRPCDKHVVELRDRVGMLHPVKADAGCRNTVYNARAQTGAEFYPLLREAGARWFRVEFLQEDPAECALLFARYRALLRGEASGADLWREFRLINQIGVTRGQLEARSRR